MSDAQKLRKWRQRKSTRSKGRKEAGKQKELLELKTKLVELENNSSKTPNDSNCGKDSMNINSSKVTKCSQKLLDGDQGIDSVSKNPDLETYVVDTISTDNNQS